MFASSSVAENAAAAADVVNSAASVAAVHDEPALEAVFPSTSTSESSVPAQLIAQGAGSKAAYLNTACRMHKLNSRVAATVKRWRRMQSTASWFGAPKEDGVHEPLGEAE